MKRIVKEATGSGHERFVVETNTRFFGLIRTKWRIDKIVYYYGIGDVKITREAIFESLEEAQKFCGILHKDKVVKREIL